MENNLFPHPLPVCCCLFARQVFEHLCGLVLGEVVQLFDFSPCSHILRGVVVAFADTLVSADFGIFAFPLLHEGLQLGIVGVRNSLRIHLDDEVTASLLDAGSNVHNGLLQPGDTGVLVEAGVGQDVERRRNKPDFDLVVFGVASLGCAQGSLDGVDTLVLEACYFDVGADLCGLGSQALSDV